MSFRAKRHKCGLPSTSICFILQFGCLCSSFTRRPNESSSLEASILRMDKKMRKRKIKTILVENNVSPGPIQNSTFNVFPLPCSVTLLNGRHWLCSLISNSTIYRMYIKECTRDKDAILNLTTMFSLSTWRERKMQHMRDGKPFSSSRLQHHLSNHPCIQRQNLLCRMNLVRTNHVLQEKIKGNFDQNKKANHTLQWIFLLWQHVFKHTHCSLRVTKTFFFFFIQWQHD